MASSADIDQLQNQIKDLQRVQLETLKKVLEIAEDVKVLVINVNGQQNIIGNQFPKHPVENQDDLNLIEDFSKPAANFQKLVGDLDLRNKRSLFTL